MEFGDVSLIEELYHLCSILYHLSFCVMKCKKQNVVLHHELQNNEAS